MSRGFTFSPNSVSHGKNVVGFSVRSILMPLTSHIASSNCHTPKFSPVGLKLTCCQPFYVQRLPKSGKGRIPLPIRMIFRKNSKRPLTPPHFWKLYCNFLWQIWLHICEEIWWLDSMKCMHIFSRYRCNTMQLFKITYPDLWNYYFVSISWTKSPV